MLQMSEAVHPHRENAHKEIMLTFDFTSSYPIV